MQPETYPFCPGGPRSIHHAAPWLNIPSQPASQPVSYSLETLICLAQVGAEYWGKGSEELQLHVFRGYLCTGCMDKAQYGRHGLLHSVQVTSLALELELCVPAAPLTCMIRGRCLSGAISWFGADTWTCHTWTVCMAQIRDASAG